MEYKAPAVSKAKIAPRLIIHGGAGNIARPSLGDDKYAAYREALVAIVRTILATSNSWKCPLRG
jgi:L-asparaginase